MIELRWKEISDKEARVSPVAIQESHGGYWRVLQYRQRIYGGVEPFAGYGKWSEWEDVPTVREE